MYNRKLAYHQKYKLPYIPNVEDFKCASFAVQLLAEPQMFIDKAVKKACDFYNRDFNTIKGYVNTAMVKRTVKWYVAWIYLDSFENGYTRVVKGLSATNVNKPVINFDTGEVIEFHKALCSFSNELEARQNLLCIEETFKSCIQNNTDWEYNFYVSETNFEDKLYMNKTKVKVAEEIMKKKNGKWVD